MRCRAARRKLSAYTDGALALYEMVALKEHLSGCAACREELRALREVNRLLAETAGAEPEIDWRAFEADLSARLARERLDPWNRPWYRRERVLRRAAAAACALLVLVGAGVWLNGWLKPSLLDTPTGPFGPGSTLRCEGRRPVEISGGVEVQAARREPTPAGTGRGEGAPRLAWLAGEEPRPTGQTSRVVVRFPTDGTTEEHRYLFRAPGSASAGAESSTGRQ